MGLSSFWSSITGQTRIKEIAPEYQNSWLDRGRPVTSASTRTAKRFRSEGFGSGSIKSDRPTTGNVGRKVTKLGRSLSRSRQKSRSELKIGSDADGGESGARPVSHGKADAEHHIENVPTVPSLPPVFSKGHNRKKSLPPPPGDIDLEPVRPGTAITTRGVELSEPTERSTGSEPTEETMSVAGAEVSRKRSQSSVSLSRRVKSASFLQNCKRTSPLPPPSIPLPPIPTANNGNELAFATSPTREYHHSPQSRVEMEDYTMPRGPQRPSLQKRCSEEYSILQAFPPVPGLVRDSLKTPESSMPNSEAEDGIDHVVAASSTQVKSSSHEKRRPNPIRTSNNARRHAQKDSAIGTPRTPNTASEKIKEEHKRSPKVQDDDEDCSSCLSIEQQRDWNRLTRMMESMDKEETQGAIQMSKEMEMDADRMHTAKFSNEQGAGISGVRPFRVDSARMYYRLHYTQPFHDHFGEEIKRLLRLGEQYCRSIKVFLAWRWRLLCSRRS